MTTAQKHKCGRDGCEKLCHTEFCSSHSRKFNNCLYEGCIRQCRGEYCMRHNPETRKKATEYHNNWYKTNKDTEHYKAKAQKAKENAPKMPKKKCDAEGCERQCYFEFCNVHARKYNTCSVSGCGRRCLAEVCCKHNDTTKEIKRNYKDRLKSLRSSPEPLTIITNTNEEPNNVDDQM